jgi:plasmid stabilization system protein ParE
MEIVWRPQALGDLEAARRYIAENNPRAAARVHAAILTSVARLASHPNLGRPGRISAPANSSSHGRLHRRLCGR